LTIKDGPVLRDALFTIMIGGAVGRAAASAMQISAPMLPPYDAIGGHHDACVLPCLSDFNKLFRVSIKLT
jgi:hypothetical protein